MKLAYIFVIFLMIYVEFSECIDCSVHPKNTEARLRQDLLCSYDKDTRPTGGDNNKNGTLVTIQMFLKSFEYGDYSGMIDLNTQFEMHWTDNHFKWDPAEYDDIETLTIHSDEIWMPDFAIYNSESTQFEETCSAADCVLYSKGSVACSPKCSHSGSCIGVYKDWPFDIQNCTLHFGSWMHKGSEITYKSEKIVIYSDALQNNRWKIVAMNYKNIPGNYSCCPNETYPSIRVNIIVERHSAAQTAYIITPAFILAVINLTGLWLSPGCPERIILNVISLLSHFIFQEQLSWIVPKNGDVVPKAITFFRDSMIITTILLLLTVILRGILSCKSDTPNWIKSTTNSLKGNRIGQLMFTNPYLINKGTPLNNDDSASLVGEQPNEQINQNQNQNQNNGKIDETTNIWVTTVRIIDSLMFIALLVSYVVLLVGWLPTSGVKFTDAIKADIIETN